MCHISNSWNLFDLFNYMSFYQYALKNPKNINLLIVVVYFFLTHYDWLFVILRYTLVLNNYLWCSFSLVLNFILKIYNFFVFQFFLFVLIKSDKQVDTINPFNKWVVLGLRNLDPFNKHVRLVLTRIVGYL